MIRPSDVPSRGALCPFPGALGSIELELAAFVLIRFLAEHGDEWRAVEPLELRGWLQELPGDDPLVTLLNNPFARPDYHGLVVAELARFEGLGIALEAQCVQACARKGGAQ